MLRIKRNYENVSVEYTINGIRISKKLTQVNQNDIDTAEKYGVNLGKYFEKTELPSVESTELPTISYEGIEQKPKRKKK